VDSARVDIVCIEETKMAAVSQQVLLSMLGSDLTILLQCRPLELVVE